MSFRFFIVIVLLLWPWNFVWVNSALTKNWHLLFMLSLFHKENGSVWNVDFFWFCTVFGMSWYKFRSMKASAWRPLVRLPWMDLVWKSWLEMKMPDVFLITRPRSFISFVDIKLVVSSFDRSLVKVDRACDDWAVVPLARDFLRTSSDQFLKVVCSRFEPRVEVTWALGIATLSIEGLRISFCIFLLHFVLLLAICVLSRICVLRIVLIIGSRLVFFLSESTISTCRFLNSFVGKFEGASDRLHLVDIAFLKSL